MKTCVFITGTNAVGKSALAWEIITRYGGVDRITNDVSYCKEGVICFAGRYGETRYGGVDRITNDKGSSCTSRLAEVVEEGLKHCEIIICEGSFLDTFGMNLMNALFKAERQCVISLYADNLTIFNRLVNRSNGKNGKRSAKNIEKVFNKQLRCMRAAKKWQEIGVRVLQINTAEKPLQDVASEVLEFINKEQ